MTVYVDTAFIPARVGRITSRWCHLTADTEDELHEFAVSIGLRREWFQVPKGIGSIKPAPDSRAAQNWHYDVTEGRRIEALRRGAVEVSCREMSALLDARHARLFPEAAARYQEARAARIGGSR